MYDTKYDGPEYQPSPHAVHSHQAMLVRVGDRPERLDICAGSVRWQLDELAILAPGVSCHVQLAPPEIAALPQLRAVVAALDMEHARSRDQSPRAARRARRAMRRAKRFEARCVWTRDFLRHHRRCKAASRNESVGFWAYLDAPAHLRERARERFRTEFEARRGTTCDRDPHTGRPV